jgi:hypothetical protein
MNRDRCAVIAKHLLLVFADARDAVRVPNGRGRRATVLEPGAGARGGHFRSPDFPLAAPDFRGMPGLHAQGEGFVLRPLSITCKLLILQ